MPEYLYIKKNLLVHANNVWQKIISWPTLYKFFYFIICLHFSFYYLLNKFLILGNKNANHRQNIWFK